MATKTMGGCSYAIGVVVIFASAYAQYFIAGITPVARILIVYGIPVFVLSLICGKTILSRFFSNSRTALKYGLGFFGIFSLFGMLAGAVIYLILAGVDPSALNLLHRPNPVLHVWPHTAWIMVAVSMVLVGPVEEYIFRGFVYGGLLKIFHGRHWFLLAVVSAVLFAAAHLYYLIVYGAASLVAFAQLVAIGTAMAATFYYSGGNLLIPALLHGAFDAAGFIAVDLSSEIGVVLRQLMIATGLFTAAWLYYKNRKPGR